MIPEKIKSINHYHRFMGLPGPKHPLISLISFDEVKSWRSQEDINLIIPFYSIGLKRNLGAKLKYGQQEYDFDSGVLTFMAPGQVLSVKAQKDVEVKQSGWLLLIHPDFLWNTALAKSIKQYEFFDYAVNEALFLSEDEETTLTGVMQNIQREYQASIDRFSGNIITAQIEVLLNYAERFYNRQFLTRKITHHTVLNRLEEMLTVYFDNEDLIVRGLPTVNSIAEALHLSPNYLSNLLTALTGQSNQQHIHDKLIEKAKEKLTSTELSVSEIAYSLGFEHPQSFSKLFKTKAGCSPLKFKASFN
jgi:AraC family transcriptional activator of pobA